MKIFNRVLVFIFLLYSTNGYCVSESTLSGNTAEAHIVQSNGTSLRPRPYINFTGSGITCSDSGGKTVCTISGGTPSQWTESGTNLYAPTTDTVTIGTSSTSSNAFTVNADGSLGNGSTVNYTPAGIGGCDSNALLLGHFNGANGATTSTDANCTGAGAQTFTFAGDAQLSTSAPIFGSASLSSAGASGYVTVPDSANWTIGSGNVTIEMDVIITDVTLDFSMVEQYQNGTNFNQIVYTAGGGGHINFYAIRGANDSQIGIAFSPVNGTKYHIAYVRSGASTWNVYVNGVNQALTTNDNSITDYTDLSAVLGIGKNTNSGVFFKGKIDEVRWSNSARWASGFTPPASEYTSSNAYPEYKFLASGVQTAKIWTDGANSGQLTFTVVSTDVMTQTTTNTTLNTTLTMADAKNIITNTATGTSFGNGTTQKTSAYGVTPVVQGLATADLGTILSNWGLRATGTAYPITTSGTKTFSDLTVSQAVFTNGSSALVSNAITGSGNVVMSASPTLTGSPLAPTQTVNDNSTKIATTAYVDNAVLGQDFKEAVKYASTAALPSIVYSNGSSGVGATLTGVALAAISLDSSSPAVNDRVLIKNQASDFQNGIYTVTATGSGIAVFVLTRTTDADQASDWKTGDSLFVTNGSTLSSTTWAYTGIDSPTIGTTSLTFVQVAGQGSFTGGTGITITGTSIAINTAVTVDKTTVQTLTNKRITRRDTTTTQSATPAINTDNTDRAHITALAQAITSFTTNLSGTPVAGDYLAIDITDDGTARAITWGASFEASTVALPTTTVISTRLDVLFVWNEVTTKWRCIAAS